MKINRKSLLEAIESVTPGISTREVVEQSSCFVFHEDKVSTFNDEVACSCKSPLKIEGAVVAQPLLTLLKKLTEEEIEVELVEGELIVKGTRRKAGIRVEQNVTLPIAEIESPTEWKKLPKNFFEAIKIVQQCCGSNEAKFKFTCVHFDAEKIEATDGFQICRYPMKMGIENSMLVRRAALKSILGKDIHEFSETERWLHFRNALGLTFSCRRYQEKYPDLGNFMEFKGVKTTLPKGLEEAVSNAEIFSSEMVGDEQITVELRKGKIKISGVGANGWYSQVLDTNYDGEEVSFVIPPDLLVDISKRTEQCEITPNRLKVQGEKFCYVTCVGRVKSEEK